MRHRKLFRGDRRVAAGVTAVAIAAALAACNVDRVLAVHDPDIVNPVDVSSPSGAEAVRVGALGRLSDATTANITGTETIFQLSGLLADEFRSGDSFVERNETDDRQVQSSNGNVEDATRKLYRARLAAKQAIPLLRQFTPDNLLGIGEQFFVISFAENQIAEDFCNGMPFSELAGATVVNGAPLSNAAAFQMAADHADSGLAVIGASTSDQANVLRIAKGRALLNLGQFAAAAAAVATVPTSFKYQNTQSITTGNNTIWEFNNNEKRYVVANLEGGNGLNFVSAADPRVPTTSGGNAFDSSTPWIGQKIYGQESPVTIAGGVEARLIEAEAAINTGGTPANFIIKINAARAAQGLAPLVDPVTAAARVDLLFRERAFSFFGTGHRLGDLRRLVRQYSRSAATVFPTGAYFKGGSYGPDVNFIVPQAEQNNPLATAGCTDRNA
ncbi:MAG: RagB/SusD family nutrient uptake outer membrane protein [Gemmatimonadota bacterium]|nr:RagB/SusD family nutrient uptake outer membrane protein [Gemmatimonadota bacterium]